MSPRLAKRRGLAVALLAASLLAALGARANWVSTLLGGGKPLLRMAASDERVVTIRHCGDSYALTTADGKTRRFWEFNLRFKTDSGFRGPPEGSPVLLASGMSGDRAYLVFANPQEISGLIRDSCEGT